MSTNKAIIGTLIAAAIGLLIILMTQGATAKTTSIIEAGQTASTPGNLQPAEVELQPATVRLQ